MSKTINNTTCAILDCENITDEGYPFSIIVLWGTIPVMTVRICEEHENFAKTCSLDEFDLERLNEEAQS